MITVVGEALIDLVVDHEGRVLAKPGGGPFNTARTLARLGAAPVFLGRLSRDGFGKLLRERLGRDGVRLAVPELASAPTTLAAVDLDAEGAPRYGFYLDRTSAGALEYPSLAAAIPVGITALYAGSLALMMEPIGTGIERLITSDVSPAALVMIDPNCRPGAASDPRAYRARLSRVLRRADVVKVSVEDLNYIYPGMAPDAAATLLIGSGPRLVIVTDGPRRARALLRGPEVSVEVPAVRVVDTIGAGDALGGAFLAWWLGHDLTKADLRQPGAVREALRAAVEVAVITCTRAGAEPPWLAEVTGKPGWQAALWAERQASMP
jgi:fructokinase